MAVMAKDSCSGGGGTFPLTDTYLTEEMEEIGSPMHVLKGVWTSFSVQFR